MNATYENHCPDADSKTLDQFFSALKQDWVVKGALMPDAHAGYALPIGAVVATEDVIVPSWVGYDIGCGVLALETSFDPNSIRENDSWIFTQIREQVPLGFAHHKEPQKWFHMSYLQNLRSQWMTDYTMSKEIETQLGTLGSGNHFIEIGVCREGKTWIVVHSGSRNFGHQTATHYMKLASGDGKAREGHFPLHKGTLDFSNYMSDQKYVLEFALENRLQIARKVFSVMCNTLGDGEAKWNSLINRNHNHVEYDADFKVYIHRKGATHAEEGMLGVVPGNMLDGSYIVRGKGNPDWLWSSSHGAGRTMSRSKAKQEIDIDHFQDLMRDGNVYCTANASTVDESPYAYKNITTVMDRQFDSVEVMNWIKPLINVKGV
jgi:tRNA-splicing ligase RtcB (3'-phosphate/5'-hydroxy nucleic acid ligase)